MTTFWDAVLMGSVTGTVNIALLLAAIPSCNSYVLDKGFVNRASFALACDTYRI